MSANSQFTTAVHALCWIELAARDGESPLTSERIAESLASHPVLVRRGLAPLRRAGLVKVSRGPGSGWQLGRPAERITLRDIYLALDSGAPFALHPHEPKPDCPVGHGIRPALTEVYADVNYAMNRELDRHTIAGLLDHMLQAYPLP
ncbi:Rrf2 family transcriptional regulator [Micromonospora sp. NPDC000663]|uniref:Rrf2 family transcriptional regulator n=1 Tax=Micromonospora sp. NPDC000663 TaxID=3364218 RepID=UPI003680BA80